MFQSVSKNVFAMAKEEFLDKESLLKVIRKYKRCKDEAEKDRLRDIIVQSNMRMVIKLAQAYATRFNLNADDLFQNGVIGILVALERFKGTRKVAFSTYAMYWIDNLIRKCLDDSKLINTHRFLQTVNSPTRTYFECFGKSGGDAEKFIALLRKNKITQAMQTKIERVISINNENSFMDIHSPVSTGAGGTKSGGGEYGDSRLIDILEDKESSLPEDEALNNIVREKIFTCIEKELTPQEQIVIKGIFFEDKPNFRKICTDIGKCRQTMKKINHRALEKISRALARDKKFVVLSFEAMRGKKENKIGYNGNKGDSNGNDENSPISS